MERSAWKDFTLAVGRDRPRMIEREFGGMEGADDYWHEHGAELLAEDAAKPHPYGYAWAIEEFGDPGEADDDGD